MIENRLEVFETIKEELEGYNIETRDDFDQAIIEICDGLIDIATYDLIESIHFLHNEGLLDYIDGDLMEAVFAAQYDYYRDISVDYEDDLLASVEFNEDDEEE